MTKFVNTFKKKKNIFYPIFAHIWLKNISAMYDFTWVSENINN